MKRTILTSIALILSLAAAPAGYDHWNARQFAAREVVLHNGVQNGLASEVLGSWGNHLLLKTRREGSSGQAEQHEKQADLIVVQSGHAAMIIGGKILNGIQTGPNERRGTAIEGGERRSLTAGDVLHIPPKTPHQVLLEPGQTLDYIVLKVDSQ
jgi:uncharacterized RmlC-like cupin family protein